jgi:hypothetical protein
VVRSGAHVDVALKDVTDDELLALLNVVIKEVG